MAKTVIVFDFDKTIIDCDCDEWIVDEFGLNDLFSLLFPTLPLNLVMNRMMEELHSRGKTIQDVSECLRQIPMNPRIISAIKSVHASGCDLRIASNTNVFFIETILRNYGLMDCFSEINANSSYVDGNGRLTILSYNDYNLNNSPSIDVCCTICPPNMCKGVVMEKIIKDGVFCCGEGRKSTFVYVGDGAPDFCAGLRLEGGDLLMARKEHPIWELIRCNSEQIKASVREWSEVEELGDMLLYLIDENPDLHPMVSVNGKYKTNLISADRNIENDTRT